MDPRELSPVDLMAVITPDDSGDLDPRDETGLTVGAYERLVAALNGAGFSILEIRGPN